MPRLIVSISVVVAVFLAGMWAHAQTRRTITQSGTIIIAPPPSTIIAGADLGFRVEGHKGDTPLGRLVVRINGQWVEVEDAFVTKPLTVR
jgi:hypothetical protein